ncbi:MAG: RluA family pseudouridine synthase [Syntrophobacteraceae bacterium]
MEHFLIGEWPVFYLDNHLLALYKPAGLLVQSDQTGDVSLLELAKDWIKRRFDKPGRVFLGMVHRLDRPVAGVVCFARTSKAAARLSEQFRSGMSRKEYLAIVEGRPRESSAQLIHFLERSENRSTRVASSPAPGRQEARLRYSVLDSREGRSLLAIDLETGRRHQIRAQLATIGHPIVGDLRYGAGAPLDRAQIALLARKLTIEHPTRKETLAFETPLPRGWPWPATFAGEAAPPWNWREIEPHLGGAWQGEGGKRGHGDREKRKG